MKFNAEFKCFTFNETKMQEQLLASFFVCVGNGYLDKDDCER